MSSSLTSPKSHTRSVRPITPAARIRIVMSISSLCENMAYFQNCIVWNILHILKFFLQHTASLLGRSVLVHTFNYISLDYKRFEKLIFFLDCHLYIERLQRFLVFLFLPICPRYQNSYDLYSNRVKQEYLHLK